MDQAFDLKRYLASPAIDASSMEEQVMQFDPASDAEVLKLLRVSFPACSLSMRVAALDMLMRRQPRHVAQRYNPR
jgi:hypothetical protein